MDKVTKKYVPIDSDIRMLMTKVKEIVGYQIYLGNGKSWRLDKNILENSKNVNKKNLDIAVEIWFNSYDKKLDFVVWSKDLKSEYLIELANNIINTHIEGIREELNNYIQCINIVMPERIVEVSSKGKSKYYIELKE